MSTNIENTYMGLTGKEFAEKKLGITRIRFHQLKSNPDKPLSKLLLLIKRIDLENIELKFEINVLNKKLNEAKQDLEDLKLELNITKKITGRYGKIYTK